LALTLSVEQFIISLENTVQKLSMIIAIAAIALSACDTTVTPLPETTELPHPTETPVPVTPRTAASPLESRGGQVRVMCTNTLSDAAAINAAIEHSALGDEIVISGQCLINQTIKLLGDRSYSGTSRSGTVLRQANGANLAALLATNTYLDNSEWTGTPVSVSHLKLDGNSANNPQAKTDGIILRAWLSVVDDVFITDMSQDGLRLANETPNGTKVKGGVNGRITNNYIEYSGRHGVSVELGITDWILSDNWIGFSGADGLHLEDASGWTIERNHIYGVPETAIYAGSLWGTSISDNYIEGFGETSRAGDWYGIYAAVQGGAASTISNNRIFNLSGKNNPASSYHFLAITVNYGTGVVSVSGNTIRGSGADNEIGLYYTVGNHRLIVTSTGNAVVDIPRGNFVDDRVTVSAGE
jgi:hypothetical protein